MARLGAAVRTLLRDLATTAIVVLAVKFVVGSMCEIHNTTAEVPMEILLHAIAHALFRFAATPSPVESLRLAAGAFLLLYLDQLRPSPCAQQRLD